MYRVAPPKKNPGYAVAANSEKEATLTKQANDFRRRIFSREDIFAGRYFRGRYFRVNSIFAKISSRENISNSLFAKFSSRENKVLYSNYYAATVRQISRSV